MEYGKTYGSKTETTSTIFMCGGCSEWWNYKLIFNNELTDYTLYREDKLGLHILPSKLIYHVKNEEVKEVFDIDEIELEDDEIIVNYEFFGMWM